MNFINALAVLVAVLTLVLSFFMGRKILTSSKGKLVKGICLLLVLFLVLNVMNVSFLIQNVLRIKQGIIFARILMEMIV